MNESLIAFIASTSIHQQYNPRKFSCWLPRIYQVLFHRISFNRIHSEHILNQMKSKQNQLCVLVLRKNIIYVDADGKTAGFLVIRTSRFGINCVKSDLIFLFFFSSSQKYSYKDLISVFSSSFFVRKKIGSPMASQKTSR